MQRDHVGIALYQIAVILFRYRLFGLVDSIENLAFVVNDAFRGVQILGNLFLRGKRSPSKTKHTTAHAVNREHDATPEAIELLVLIDHRETRFLKKFELVLLRSCLIGQSSPVFRGIAQLKFLYDLIRKTSFPEIAQAYCFAFFSLPKIWYFLAR